MRIAFMGTPPFAVRALADLAAAGHEVAMVYTQPPARRGRGQALSPTPVGLIAAQLGLPVRTPASMRDPGEIAFFRDLGLDAAVVVAYGQILPGEILEAPRHGAFNLHASLLPRWRGAAPIQRAVMAGDKVTGVQVMRMTEGLDEGPVIATEAIAVAAEDTAGSLHDKLMAAGAPLLTRALAAVEAGTAAEIPQAEAGMTYARKISAAEARIDWFRPAAEVDWHIRGLSPFPGAWFTADTSRGPARVKALLSRVEPGEGEPGTTLDDALLVACAEGAVRLLRLQKEGREVQSAEEFVRGLAVPAGARLD